MSLSQFRMPFLLVVLNTLLEAAPAALALEPVKPGEVQQFTGVIKAVKVLKHGRRELTVLTDEKERVFTADNQTLAYELTPRNRDIFAEQNKIAQIVKDANKFRRSVQELKEGEMDLALGAIGQQSTVERVTGRAAEKSERGTQVRSVQKKRGALGALSQSQANFVNEEEQRRKDYGLPAKFKKNERVIIVAKKSGDDTLAVLVVGSEPDNELKTRNPSSEGEAGRKLKNAKQLLTEAKEASGAQRDRLLGKAYERLREVGEKFPGTKETEEADKLLKDE
ncbi:MAG: hypothetical protein ACJ8FY_04725 [Gemmataceae bacterium]